LKIKEELNKIKEEKKSKESVYTLAQRDARQCETLQKEIQKLKESKVDMMKLSKRQNMELQKIKKEQTTLSMANKKIDLKYQKQVDTLKNDLIIKSQITTRSSGTVTVDYSYGAESEFGLPNQLVFDIDVKKFKLPKSVAADLNKTEKEKERLKKNKDQKGTIIIKLSNYKINKGISDDFFKEKN
jgi:hypothetical protein